MTHPATPDYAERLDTVRETLAGKCLDALLVLGPANRRYLSGFTAQDGAIGESSGAVLVTPDRAYLITSPLYSEQAKAEAAPRVEPVELRGRSVKLLPDKLKEWGVRRLGFERDYTLYGYYEDLRDNLEGGELTPLKGVVEAMRLRKSPAELDALRAAARIADEAFARVTGELRAGMTEAQVARALDEAMQELGAEGPSFPTIVAAGTNSARPHHEPSNRTLQEGDPVVVDMGARHGGYCSDMTRSFCLGDADARYRALYDVVLEAHHRSVGSIRDGLSGKDADGVAREVLTAAGYEKEFNHSLGHGVGMDVHEPPSLWKDSEDTLGAGMVVTVEPGVYIAEYGGVRIEDTVVVTPDGAERLNHAPKDPVMAIR